MGDFDKFQPDNREHDEWADSFFAEVLSGAGTASRPKTRLYGQFGNEPDEPETGVNETAREQENASAVTEQRLEQVQPRSDTVFDPSSVTSRLRGYSTPTQNANVATQNADIPAQNPDGEPAGNKAPESGENSSGPEKEAEPALSTEPETEPDNEPETDADADKKPRRITIAIIAILLAVLLFLVGLCGYYIGRISSRVSTKKAATGYSVDFTEQGLDDEQTAKLQSVYRFIIDNYYTDVDPNELIEGAVRGMAESINDPYGSYYRPGKMSDYTDFIDGSYNGIGMTVKTVDGSIIVTEVAEDSPASRAGIVPGDVVKA
ncbi:MAG: hypothetical protein IKY07_06370, partial [Clostridia bacterium]|nr:hypothetical protein [Clostridia bacterium]